MDLSAYNIGLLLLIIQNRNTHADLATEMGWGVMFHWFKAKSGLFF